MTDRIPCCELSDQSTVNLWVVDLDDRSVPDATLDAILSPDEKKRAARFLFEPDAWHFKLCRVMLRIGLALHLGKTAKGIQITTTEKGKPYLDEGDLHFNVSHCGGTGLLAFTLAGEIGVDVEAVRTDVEGLEIAAQNFHAREIEFIASADDSRDQACRFTRIWTRKEAVLKATGDGVTDGLSSFDVSQKSKSTIPYTNPQRDTSELILNVEDIAISGTTFGAVAGPNREWTICQASVNPGILLGMIPPAVLS